MPVRGAAPASRRQRVFACLSALLLQGAILLAIVHGFDVAALIPDDTATPQLVAAYDVPLEAMPSPSPAADAARSPAGTSAPPAKQAVPREVAAPAPRLRVPAPVAPPVAATGDANTGGAAAEGAGQGAGGSGADTGAGASGTGGSGGTGARKAMKIAGDIRSARDYPEATRTARLGSSVIIVLVVGVDGRPKSCEVRKPSGDPQADAITCRLAIGRFRFKPAVDEAGNPVESIYGWEQRWFTP